MVNGIVEVEDPGASSGLVKDVDPGIISGILDVEDPGKSSGTVKDENPGDK